jgi:uncharacterized Tic20 family protein
MNAKFDELEKLNDLLKNGIITQDEFNREKEKILNSSYHSSNNELFGLKENTYCMLIHLSLLLGFVHLLLGIIAPILLWILNKDKNNQVDNNGKIVFNWILSMFIYTIIILIIILPSPFNIFSRNMFDLNLNITFNNPFAFIPSILPLFILMLLNIIFIIAGAIKANSGILWNYPLSIRFFKLKI